MHEPEPLQGAASGTIEAAIAAAEREVARRHPAHARDLGNVLRCVHAAHPDATTVLGGSLAFGHGAPADLDLFVILPSRRAVLAALRDGALERRLETLRLGIDLEITWLWDALVRRAATPVHGRLLTGDRSLEAAIAASPAPPASNLLATAHLFLLQSLLEPARAGHLLAKAVLTGFRAWLSDRAARRGLQPSMATLFSARENRRALAAAGAALGLAEQALVRDALAHQAGEPVRWETAEVRERALAMLARLEVRATRRARRLLRHLAARRHFGARPLALRDPTPAFVAAVRGVVAAAVAGDGPDPAPLREGERALRRLLGEPNPGTPSARLDRAIRILARYGTYYPHKTRCPAPPAVPPPARPPVLVSFVVPCRNGAATLPALLASIAAQEVPAGYALEAVVVDNTSTDASAAVAARHGAVVVTESRPGASAARNMGLRRARGELVVFVDADAALRGRDFVHHVARAFAHAPDVGLVGAAVECDPAAGPIGRADHMVSFFNWQPTQFGERRHFHPSVALAVRRRVAEELGGFAPELLRFHDFDFCRRARAAGHAVYFEPAARVIHAPRDRLGAALRHSFEWGLNVRRVYARHDPERRWRLLDRPWLFALNVPLHVANRLWLLRKRWLWRRPVDTVLLAPLLVLLLGAWGAGIARGGHRWIRDARAGVHEPPLPRGFAAPRGE